MPTSPHLAHLACISPRISRASRVPLRHDLRFKLPLLSRLDLATLRGVRFLWFEARGEWRQLWRGPEEGTPAHRRATAATRERWERTTQRMARHRANAYQPGWQPGWARARVPDAVHVLSGAAVGCFVAALRYEMTTPQPCPLQALT